MALSVLLPEGMRPTNLHLTPFYKNEDGVLIINKARVVTADMFMICQRIGEINPRLYLLELEQDSREGQKFGYAVMEKCVDGVDRVIFRVSKDGLDGRVLEKLRYIMGLSLHERIDFCDREREREERHQAEDASEEIWETVGGPMWVELEKDGFLSAPRPVSYRKLNRAARRSLQHNGRRSVMGLNMPAEMHYE
jgi:hypothetical protein